MTIVILQNFIYSKIRYPSMAVLCITYFCIGNMNNLFFFNFAMLTDSLQWGAGAMGLLIKRPDKLAGNFLAFLIIQVFKYFKLNAWLQTNTKPFTFVDVEEIEIENEIGQLTLLNPSLKTRPNLSKF